MNYATGKPLTGSYYAVIEIEDESGCKKIGRTVIVNCDNATGAPELIPTLAQPAEQMRLTNLNPEQETTIRVFSTSGRLLNQYKYCKTFFVINLRLRKVEKPFSFLNSCRKLNYLVCL